MQFVRTAFWILLGLLILSGCAHPVEPTSPSPDPLEPSLGKVGLAIQPFDDPQSLEIPGAGRLGSVGRGAALGAVEGVAYGGQAGVPIAIPVGAALGAVAGAIVGAVAPESWEDPQATFLAVVARLQLDRALPAQMIDFAQSHGYDVAHLRADAAVQSDQPSLDAAALGDGIDTVLEIRQLTVQLTPASMGVSPPRGLVLSARVRLVRAADQSVLDDRAVIDVSGPKLTLGEWAAQDAARFREEVHQASLRLGEQIITDQLMLHPLPERVIPLNAFLDLHLEGLQLLYPWERATIFLDNGIVHEEDIRERYAVPRTEFVVMALRANSLRPTMLWDPLPVPDVTYDLKIWRAGPWGPDAVVYCRTNLQHASHELETALEPSTLYYWSVRAHFSDDGRDRVTAWSRRWVTPSLLVKVVGGIISLGTSALQNVIVEEGFLVFITPPIPADGPSGAPSCPADMMVLGRGEGVPALPSRAAARTWTWPHRLQSS